MLLKFLQFPHIQSHQYIFHAFYIIHSIQRASIERNFSIVIETTIYVVDQVVTML